MKPVSAARLIPDRGLEGDRHARAGSRRQVLLADRETLDALEVRPGQIRENLTTEGIAVQALPSGTRLRVGPALLEITGPCEPCAFMDTIRPGLREASRGRRGVTARVIEGGEVQVGDPVAAV